MDKASSPARSLTERGSLAAAFVVGIGLVVPLFEAERTPLLLLHVLGLGALYLGLLMTWGERLADAGGLHRCVYFAAQLALAAAIFQAFGETFPMTWLILMPLIVHSRLLLPPPGTLAVCLVSLGLVTAHLYWVAGWRGISAGLGGITSAVVFVLLFTDVARREAAARGDSERLGADLAAANRQLTAHALQAEELAAASERARLAREIHDSLGHYLTVVNVQLEAALAMFERDPLRARQAVEKAQALTREGLEEIRRSVAVLRRSPVDHQELGEAVAELAQASREAGLQTELIVQGEPRQLTAQAKLTLFRAAQEGLTNVRKHARASHADVVIDFRRADRVLLSVQDDGVGSDSEPEGGFGLLGVRERVRQLAGQCAIRTRAGGGLALEVEVPG